MVRSTSWDDSADWYADLLENDIDSYQRKVILPNLVRLLSSSKNKNEALLDLACGSGFFSRELSKLGFFARGPASPKRVEEGGSSSGGKVVAVDISSQLIEIAKKLSPKEISYIVAAADALPFKDKSFDKIVIILALQNMENVDGVLGECERILRPGGEIYVVLNHPILRVPKSSSWGWDEKNKIQYRRIDKYISETKVKIQMHPGDKPDERTTSFHRPLQYYFKLFDKHNLVVERLEEWLSHKKSQPGPRAKAEDQSRKEIPLFMFLKLIKK